MERSIEITDKNHIDAISKGGIIIGNHIITNGLYDLATERLQVLKKEKEQLEVRIQKAPQGSIRFIERAGRIQFYVRTDPKDKSGKYLRKNEDVKIKLLLQKSYDEKILKILNAEIDSLEQFVSKSNPLPQKIKELYSALPTKVRQYVNPLDVTDEEYAKRWLEIPYVGKGMSEDKEIFKTNRDEYVRSKSELTIANAMHRAGVPYKYECPLRLANGTVIHPDFTALNVRKRKIYYWEHRGMMDTADYARGAVNRNKEYMKNHIILGENLIITEETSVSPLSTKEIDVIIRKFLI